MEGEKNMRLRRLEQGDAELMLEWMHEPEAEMNFRFNAHAMALDDVKRFIADSWTQNARNYAVVADDGDEYLGTITLRKIDTVNQNAEYAIAMRKKARGTGIAREATVELLRIAFMELGLIKVYLDVYEYNHRARRFYEKLGFLQEGCLVRHIKKQDEWRSLCLYAIFKEDFQAKWG